MAQGMTIRELILKYTVDADTKPLDKFESAISNLKMGALGLGGIITATAGTLAALTIKSASAADAQAKMSQRLGVGIDALRELSLRAKLANLEQGELEIGLQMVSRRLGEAANGSGDAQKAFAKMGINAKALVAAGVPTEQILKQISERFNAMPDGPQKVAASMDLFGRSGSRLIPFLKELQNELDPTTKAILEMGQVTEEQLQAADQFGDNIDLAKEAVGALTKSVGLGLVPVANDLVKEFIKFVIQNKAVIKGGILAFVRTLTSALKVALSITKAFIESFRGLAEAFGGTERVLKVLLAALAVFSGAQILLGIGKLVQAVILFGNAATVAQAKALAIPLLIGAAVVALGLIFEDLYNYLNGNDSAFGLLEEKFPEVASWLKVIGGLILTSVTMPFRAAANAIGAILDLMDVFQGKMGVIDFAKNIGSRLTNTFAGSFGNTASPFQSALGLGDPRANIAGLTGGPNQTNTIAPQVNINVGPDAPVSDIARATESAVSQGSISGVRELQRATVGGVSR